MARTSFLFRADPKVMEALKRWADDELRSVNGQLEFIVRQALKQSGRLKPPPRDQEE
ncbi:MAG: Arc family DNA-binding protein [Pseudomonadota bacterium]